MISYVSNRCAPSPMAMTAPVSEGLIGPGGGQVAGVVGDPEPDAPGPGSVLDDVLASLDSRISALEDGAA